MRICEVWLRLSQFGKFSKVIYDAWSEGASVHEKWQKKVWIFRPIDVFNLRFFKSDDLVILTVYGILALEDRQFFLFFMVFSKDNTFEKDHCTKNPNFFFAEKSTHLPTGRHILFFIENY